MLASVFEREKHLDTKFKKRVKQLQDDLKIKQWIQNSQKVIVVVFFKLTQTI